MNTTLLCRDNSTLVLNIMFNTSDANEQELEVSKFTDNLIYVFLIHEMGSTEIKMQMVSFIQESKSTLIHILINKY